MSLIDEFLHSRLSSWTFPGKHGKKFASRGAGAEELKSKEQILKARFKKERMMKKQQKGGNRGRKPSRRKWDVTEFQDNILRQEVERRIFCDAVFGIKDRSVLFGGAGGRICEIC